MSRTAIPRELIHNPHDVEETARIIEELTVILAPHYVSAIKKCLRAEIAREDPGMVKKMNKQVKKLLRSIGIKDGGPTFKRAFLQQISEEVKENSVAIARSVLAWWLFGLQHAVEGTGAPLSLDRRMLPVSGAPKKSPDQEIGIDYCARRLKLDLSVKQIWGGLQKLQGTLVKKFWKTGSPIQLGYNRYIVPAGGHRRNEYRLYLSRTEAVDHVKGSLPTA